MTNTCSVNLKATSTAEANLPQNITKLKEALKTAMAERDFINKKLLEYEAHALFSEGRWHADIRLVKKIFADRTQNEIKLLAKKILETSTDTVILFGIKTERNAQLIFQCSKGLPFDMGKLIETACEFINGRGGGQTHQAQGGGPLVEKLEDALHGAEDLVFKLIH